MFFYIMSIDGVLLQQFLLSEHKALPARTGQGNIKFTVNQHAVNLLQVRKQFKLVRADDCDAE